MEFIYFTLAGIVLYLAADWVLLRIEMMRGSLLPHRSFFFFGIILTLTLLLFQAIQLLVTPVSAPTPAEPGQTVEQPAKPGEPTKPSEK